MSVSVLAPSKLPWSACILVIMLGVCLAQHYGNRPVMRTLVTQHAWEFHIACFHVCSCRQNCHAFSRFCLISRVPYQHKMGLPVPACPHLHDCHFTFGKGQASQHIRCVVMSVASPLIRQSAKAASYMFHKLIDQARE